MKNPNIPPKLIISSKKYKNKKRQQKTKHNRAKNNIAKQHNDLIIGKITADWCGHCQHLQPKWEIMEKEIINECSPIRESDNVMYLDNHNNKIQFYKINSENQEEPIQKLNNTYLLNSNEKLEANGYPTIFKINGNQLQYYQGEREPQPMKQWFFSNHIGGKKRKTKKNRNIF